MRTWLISDTHFGEQPARRQKLSDMAGETLDALIRCNWQSRVMPGDTVWHLGDIGKAWRALEDLPGVKHLVLAHSSDRRPAIARSGVFETIQETAWLECPSGPLFLVHDPDPFVDDPRTIVHGHHHYAEPGPGRFSVCVDHIGWAPILLEELVKKG